MNNKNNSMLIVDDEIDILKTFREIFELRGWQVFTAPTGTIGMSILEKEKIDIVLLDIRLPDRSGMDALQDIKKKYPDVSVIMVTAMGYKDDLVNEAIKLGAAGYVSKGVPLRELLEVVNNTVKK